MRYRKADKQHKSNREHYLNIKHIMRSVGMSPDYPVSAIELIEVYSDSFTG